MKTSLFSRCLLEAGILLPCMVMALLPVHHHFRYPARRTWATALFAASVCTVLCAVLCTGFSWRLDTAILFGMILLFLPYAACSDLGLSRNLFCFSTATLLAAFCPMYTTFLMGPAEIANGEGVFFPASGAVSLSLSFIIILVFWRTLYKKLPFLLENESLSELWKWIMLLPVGFTLMCFWMKPVDPSVVMAGRVRIISLWIFLFIPFAVLFLFHVFWWIASRLTAFARVQKENDLLKMEEKRTSELLAYMDNTRMLRHDFRQHLHVLESFARNGELEKLKDYLQPLLHAADRSTPQLCRNKAVDALAAYYFRLARAQDTVMRWHLDLEEQLPVQETDLCALLGNLLENALHAVSALPPEERAITTVVQMLSSAVIGIDIRNPYTGEISFGRSGLPVSSDAEHGVGMISVSSTVDRYNGTMDVSTEGGVFSVSIVLYAKA